MVAASTNIAPAVEVIGLGKHFRRVRAVDDISLTIPAGGVYGLLGPNGSGKTTLLSMLAGFLTPTAGAITLLGESGTSGLNQVRGRMGAMIERPIFWPYLSCRDNLRCLQGLYESEGRHDEIDRLLELVNLDGDAARRKFRACSTGMKQRLGIAATLLGDPELLILDEPTNGLDPAGIIEVRELIRSLASGTDTVAGQPRTVILASHLLNEVEQVCDHVGVMARGKLLYSGPVEGISSKSQVRVRTTNDTKARSVLREAGWTVGDKSDEGLQVSASPGNEWKISRELAEHEVYIAEMVPSGASLEEGFLEVTGNAERDD
jgi:ABC-2 type transport system ATP-binding protein